MKRAILFRYHDRFDVCAGRIALLRALNPAVAIYGMFGGSPDATDALDFDDRYVLPFADAGFKWRNCDLCVAQWYRDRGHTVPFDVVHIVEWDLILLRPLDVLYGIEAFGVAVTRPRTIRQLKQAGWSWVTDSYCRDELRRLRAQIRERHGVRITDAVELAGFFPGASFSRAFIDRYAADVVPELLHDEIRAPLYAQVYGLPVADTHFADGNPYWNCDKRLYSAAAVGDAVGRRLSAVHPVVEPIPLALLSV